MKTLKTFILTILCIMTIQDCMSERIICSKDSVCNKSDYHYTTLKECEVAPVLLGLAENFIQGNKRAVSIAAKPLIGKFACYPVKSYPGMSFTVKKGALDFWNP